MELNMKKLRKIISSILLVLFLNYLNACSVSKNIKLYKDELLQPYEKITSVVYPDGRLTEFDENGGSFQSTAFLIEGISVEDNKKISQSNFDVNELRSELLPNISVEMINGQPVSEVILDRRLIRFGSEGGKYDSQNNTIKGKFESGNLGVVSIKAVSEIHTAQPHLISDEKIEENAGITVARIILKGQKVITLKPGTDKIHVMKNVIHGYTSYSKEVFIPVDSILYANVEKFDPVLSILAGFGTVVFFIGVIFLIILATKESCPFIYSYNGNNYVFDAEPLGGTTSKGLERTELSKLEHLKSVNEKYKLLIRNEVEETQYLDEVSLYVVDHPETSNIVVDLKGQLHSISEPVAPLKAFDENGKSLLNFFEKEDRIFWQSPTPKAKQISEIPKRHKITVEFEKPEDSDKAKLVINSGTTFWGSNMIKEMLMLHGDEVDKWYNLIDSNEVVRNQLYYFLEREELFNLKINVKERDGWSVQGMVQGGGPFIAETRTYELDLSNVEGNKLTLQFNPPYGFWTINYIAVEFDEHTEPAYKEIKVASAFDYQNNSIKDLLSVKDGKYYVMPVKGNYANIEFDVPPKNPNLTRSIFLKSTGYYKIHLPQNSPKQTELLFEIGMKPGKIVDYSMEKFKEWFNELSTVSSEKK